MQVVELDKIIILLKRFILHHDIDRTAEVMDLLTSEVGEITLKVL